jgi:hypothetical protein
LKALKKDREQKVLRMAPPPEKFASHASALAPTAVNVPTSTAAALRAARAKRKFAPFCTFMTSPMGDMCQKYEVPLFFDNGVNANDYTSQKFKKFTAYFLTQDNVTYELTREEEKDQHTKKKALSSSSSNTPLSSSSSSSSSSCSSSSTASSSLTSAPTYDVYRWSIVKEQEEYNPLQFFAERKKRNNENEEEKTVEEKNKRQRLGFSQTPLPVRLNIVYFSSNVLKLCWQTIQTSNERTSIYTRLHATLITLLRKTILTYSIHLTSSVFLVSHVITCVCLYHQPAALQTLHSHIDWDNVEWGTNFIRINGNKYPVHKVSFRLNSSAQ